MYVCFNVAVSKIIGLPSLYNALNGNMYIYCVDNKSILPYVLCMYVYVKMQRKPVIIYYVTVLVPDMVDL